MQVGLIQFCISPPKSDLENNVVVSDYTQMDRVYKEERNYILGIVKKIKATGCNVLLIQKSILRDAVTDLALHYLVRGDGREWRADLVCTARYCVVLPDKGTEELGFRDGGWTSLPGECGLSFMFAPPGQGQDHGYP